MRSCSIDCTYTKGAIPHVEGCPNRGARNGKSGRHTTPRVSVPAYTADACVELGKLLGRRMMVCEYSGGIKIEAFVDPLRPTPYVARPDPIEEERMRRMTWIVNGRSGCR